MKKYEVRQWKEKIVIYQCLAGYYRGQIEMGSVCISEIAKYLRVNTQALEMEETVEYDFNRLFVGPMKLLAPPFESVYRRKDRLVMQAETLAVRQMYAKAGLAIQGKNAIPDDHMEFELAFIAYLLTEFLQHSNEEKVRAIHALELYRVFIKEHLGTWALQHLQDVIEQAQTEYCRKVATFFSAFLTTEKAAAL